MKLNANGVCDICSDLDNPIFALPESLRKAKAKVVEEVTEPATSIMNVTLVAGVAAGAMAGAFYLYNRFRRK